MADYSVTVTENLGIGDSTDDHRVKEYPTEGVGFGDSSAIFNVYSPVNSDEVVIGDSCDGIISPYIKTLQDELGIGDSAVDTLYTRPALAEEITIGDSSTGIATYPVDLSDSVTLGDSSIGGVHYAAPLTPTSEAQFGDLVSLIVSRTVEYTFNRTINSSIGTTPTTVYTVNNDAPGTRIGHILSLGLTNILTAGVAPVVVDVKVLKAGVSANYVYLAKDVSLLMGETYVINSTESGITLEVDDEIEITSDTASSLDVYASVLEIKQ